MLHKPLEGRRTYVKCGHEYAWHYYLRVPFYEEPDSEQKLYDGKDGSVYGFFDPQYSAARSPDESVLNCCRPDPITIPSIYGQPYFWGFNVPVKCDECGNREVKCIDLRESI